MTEYDFIDGLTTDEIAEMTKTNLVGAGYAEANHDNLPSRIVGIGLLGLTAALTTLGASVLLAVYAGKGPELFQHISATLQGYEGLPGLFKYMFTVNLETLGTLAQSITGNLPLKDHLTTPLDRFTR